MKKTNCKGRI